ncbi:SspB-related isopeptide-forming adhesin [Streptococcus salivarius]|uniref:SspB-related isopeptide-forming adhesin n=1 Tax=Streptococcus salivarius TaxID=1304 RepID=UPI000938F26C|nr:SspB-related isopeptide-forming adhesin [Streptococcus salivarius]
MFKDSNNTKGHGSIRKNKVYGAVGVLALGAAAIVGGTSQASADEVTEAPVNSEPVATSQANADSLMSQATAVATSDVSTPTTTATATNTTDSQPTETVAEVATTQLVSTNDNNAYAEKANTSTEAEKVTIDNTAVTDAVATAKDSGVKVTQDATQDKGTPTTSEELASKQAEIKANQNEQVASIKQATQDASGRQSAYDAADKAHDTLETQVDKAVKDSNGLIKAETTEISSGDGKNVGDYNTYTDQVNKQIASNKETIDKFNKDYAAMKDNANVNVDGRVTTQNVDQLTYGNSVQNGSVNPDGTFSFTHDMNDSANDSLGVLGTGTLNGKVNFTSAANGDGSTTVTLNSLDLWNYAYTSNRPNTGVNQNLNYHVYTDGEEIYSVNHDGNSSFAEDINRSIALNKSYVLKPGETTGIIPILNIDDNWIINTHGQLSLDFTNPNVVPSATVKKVSEPVKPEIPSVSYHDYKMDYQPTVTKTVLNSDGENVNGKMIPKNDEHTYVLNNGNIFANAKVGDTVTTRDPLEFGEVPNIEANKAENEAKGWNVDYDEASKTYTFTAKYEGETLEAPTIKFVASDDNGFYDNTYKSGRNGYETFSNTVTNKTPTAPKPHKSVTDSKGNDIDGKTTEDDKVTFHLTTDYSPYKDMAASKQALKFALLDDVQDGAFTVDEDAITIVDSKNNDVKELFDMYHVLSDEGRTDAINKILNESGLNPTGEFYLWVAKNPVDYYQDYILKNNNVTVNLPATLQVPAGTTVENDFYQIDFGNAYKSNLVSFDTPPAAPVGESGGPTSTPVTPVEEVPVLQQAIKVLPNTGEKSTSAIATAGAVILATALGMLGFSKRSKEY